jgi:serine/threonine-protein kinase RCK2
MAREAYQQPGGDAYLVADAGAQNRCAQAGNMAAHHAEQGQKIGASKGKKPSPEDLARMVAEEKEIKNKLPRYRGLERWRLVEKMGHGAFSNVYRAIDTEGTTGEVAIKVVRKFEMNSNQVSSGSCSFFRYF